MLLLFGCGCFLVSWLWSVAFINASVASGVSLLCHGRWGLGAGGRGSCANVRCLLHQWSMRDDCAEAGRHQLPGASWPPYPDFSQKLGCSIAVLEYQRVHIVCLLCMYHLIYIYIYIHIHTYIIYIYTYIHIQMKYIYIRPGVESEPYCDYDFLWENGSRQGTMLSDAYQDLWRFGQLHVRFALVGMCLYTYIYIYI